MRGLEVGALPVERRPEGLAALGLVRLRFSRAGRRRAALRFLLRLRDELLLLLLLDEDDEELDRPRRFFALPRGGRFVDRPFRCVGFRFARGRPRLRDELLELDELLDRERLRRRGILAFYS